ncbi:MAG: TraB/GumN family protein [Steroidobacteraceae bacterium]
MPRPTPALLFIAVSLLAANWSSSVRAADQASTQLEDLVVTGERTGPGMWHVHRGSAQLWILGSISPLPRGITWRSKQVEQVLGTTNMVLVPKPLEIGIVRILWLLITEHRLLMVGGGKRLKDVMPPNLYARFAPLRTKYTADSTKWERYRPIVATAFLQQAAFHQVGLSARLDLGAAVRMLARKHGVRVEEVKIAGVGDLLDALKTMPPSTENTCVGASLVTVESGLPRLIDRAQAWATGNVERIESLREPAEVDACLAALDSGSAAGDLIARVHRTWLEFLERGLQGSGTTLAVVNMDLLLGHGGLLEDLSTNGYQVDAP